jgi:hypothetical protein
VASPTLDDDLGRAQSVENFAVEQLIAKAGIEALDVAVLPGAAPLDVGGLGAYSRDPFLHRLGDELRSVVGPDVSGKKVVSWRNELVTRTEKGEDGEPVMVMMPRVTIVDADKISDEAAAAVAEVWQTVSGALRVKLHDKHAALVSLGKHLGLFVDRVQKERKQISAEPMSAEEWKRQFVREG